MKTLIALTLGLLFHLTVSAEKFYTATIVFADGHKADGLVTLPEKPTDETIRYKENEDAKAVKYKSEELAKLIFPESNGNSIEYERVTAQKRPNTTKTMIFWLQVARRGFTTLYFGDFKVAMATGGGMIVGSYRCWFAVREGETYASMVSQQGYATDNAFFRQHASEYFKDDAGLAAKINDKVYKREDIYKVLDEYNEWKESK